MSEPTRRAPDRDLLLSSHAFPGGYVIKCFGRQTDTFRQAIHLAIATVELPRAPQVSERLSENGNHLCMTLDLHVDTVDQVIAVYEEIYARADELKMIL